MFYILFDLDSAIYRNIFEKPINPTSTVMLIWDILYFLSMIFYILYTPVAISITLSENY